MLGLDGLTAFSGDFCAHPEQDRALGAGAGASVRGDLQNRLAAQAQADADDARARRYQALTGPVQVQVDDATANLFSSYRPSQAA